jgi:hypothetical protein
MWARTWNEKWQSSVEPIEPAKKWARTVSETDELLAWLEDSYIPNEVLFWEIEMVSIWDHILTALKRQGS